MKVAVVYNRDSRNVINLFGMANREKIGLKTIQRITDALKKGGHQVRAIEADKDLVDHLEDFMPRVVKGERPGMVFNVSYGIQGQARYTHVPGILEMMGIPYVASGPLAHSLALDKVVTKMILRQNDLPTPDFIVLRTPDEPVRDDLPYPMIVKPKNEAVSFGLKVVNDEDELREAAGVIFREFEQPVLCEQFIQGREVNIGIIGNSPPEAFPPVELVFDEKGPKVYTYEDKTGRSGRTISHACPAPIGDELLERSKDIAIRAFQALGCADCARVDTRLDEDGNLFILEINSLPSLGEHGSYLVGADHVGLDFAAVINRLVEVASARYFGTPQPPKIETKSGDASGQIFNYVTERRDRMEKRLQEWTQINSRTNDPIGMEEIAQRFDEMMKELHLHPAADLTDSPNAFTYTTAAGLDGGTLLVLHLDVPSDSDAPPQGFRREPEWLIGEGIATTKAPLVMLEYVLRSLRSVRRLRKTKLGVLAYKDEGREARYSSETIRKAAARASRVFVLRPGNVGNLVITDRRGRRSYRFRVEGEPVNPGRARKTEVLRWTMKKLEEFSALSAEKRRVSVSVTDIRCDRLPLSLPHRVQASLAVTYPETSKADELEETLRSLLPKSSPKCDLRRIANRPPMRERDAGLARGIAAAGHDWDIEIGKQSSVIPSVAGLVPKGTPRLCGVAPIGKSLGLPQEAVQRISLVQRTLVLARYLLDPEGYDSGGGDAGGGEDAGKGS